MGTWLKLTRIRGLLKLLNKIMTQEFASKFESKEQVVTKYVIDCRRHGEKELGEKEGKQPGLTEKGKLQGRMISKFKGPFYNTGDIYVSNIGRTEQTGQAMQETQSPAHKEALNLPASQVFTREELGDEKFWESQEFRAGYFKIKEAKGTDAAAQWYLDFKDKSPYGAISPEKAAANYSGVIMELVNKLKQGQEKNVAGALPKTIISHDLLMEPFLYYAIGDQVMSDKSLKGKTFMEKIGGAMEVVHGFSLEVEKVGQEIVALLSFRGHKYPLDLDKLQQLIAKYEKKD
jgi:hypothetical protein